MAIEDVESGEMRNNTYNKLQPKRGSLRPPQPNYSYIMGQISLLFQSFICNAIALVDLINALMVLRRAIFMSPN